MSLLRLPRRFSRRLYCRFVPRELDYVFRIIRATRMANRNNAHRNPL